MPRVYIIEIWALEKGPSVIKFETKNALSSSLSALIIPPASIFYIWSEEKGPSAIKFETKDALSSSLSGLIKPPVFAICSKADRIHLSIL